MIYKYVAYNEKRELVKGKLPAATEEAATELLGYAGYQAISLKPYVPFFNMDKLSASLFQVRLTEIILLYRQVAMLLESGTDIAASLDLLQQQATNRALKKVLAEVTSDVRSGNQFSVALEKHPKIFPSVHCRLLSVGEQSGDLESVLRQVADYMEKEAATAKETKGALMMPAITAVIAVIVIGLLIMFILPSFAGMYESLGTELPPMALMLITLGEQARSHGMYILLAVLVLAGAVFFYIKTPGGRYNWDRMLLKLPLLGRVRQLTELARCCRSLSLLFRTGLPLPEAMSMAIQSSGNRVLAKALGNVQQDMVKGEGLSRPMAKNKLFLPMMVQMVKVGEETGNLDVTLLAVARSYEAEAEDKIHSIIALLPPAMTLIIGGVVGLIAVTLMSAMTAMYGEAF
ncbi:MAG: type II secretion system F family protein [Dehalococcoidia bacterium]|nr:type II secretion system F family protein [Dehalococcoidia bacterium]